MMKYIAVTTTNHIIGWVVPLATEGDVLPEDGSGIIDYVHNNSRIFAGTEHAEAQGSMRGWRNSPVGRRSSGLPGYEGQEE